MKLFCCLLLLVPFASAQTNPPATPSAATSAPPSQTEALPPTPKQIAHMEEMLQDWPDLARYRAANAALPATRAG